MKANDLISFFQLFGEISEEIKMKLSGIIKFELMAKNTVLLDIGKRAESMFFVKKGMARAYYFHDGKDVTDYFATDGQFIGAVPSLINGLPSEKGIHLIEESEVYHFLSKDFEKLCSEYHELEHIARKILGFALLAEQERIQSLRFYSMNERYELLSKKYPGIMNRCPLHYIASYLGTSQVSISRIRAGIQ